MAFSSIFSLRRAFRHLSRASRSLLSLPLSLDALQTSVRSSSVPTEFETARCHGFKSLSARPPLFVLQSSTQIVGSLRLKGNDGNHRRVWGVKNADQFSLFQSPVCVKMMGTTAGYWFQQNVDLPANVPRRKKKPFLTSSKAGGWKSKKDSEECVLQPPANGVLVPELIPVAHDTFKARATLISGVYTLMKTFSVKACRCCSEVHVGPTGHQIASCEGPNNGPRHGRHEWVDGDIDDVLVPVNVFHLQDRLGRVITHEDRFKVDRIPAVVELCIQAGLDVPEYPTKRRTEPVQMIGKKIVDFDELDGYEGRGSVRFIKARGKKREDFFSVSTSERSDMAETSSLSIQDLASLAEKTMQAWNAMRSGARRLMAKYPVHVCGYCPEVHVGPKPHKAKICSAFKHQMRSGQHGWQEASIDDLIPPKYVWHVQQRDGSPLVTELRIFYGQTPAVVELCVQAGATVPDRYKPMMRLDVVIPDLEEVEKVA